MAELEPAVVVQGLAVPEPELEPEPELGLGLELLEQVLPELPELLVV